MSSSPRKKPRGSRGFTLIELLVVTSLISLLSSVVFASVNSARGKARYAKIVADFQEMRTAAELDADARGGAYAADLCPNQNPFSTVSACMAKAAMRRLVVRLGKLGRR